MAPTGDIPMCVVDLSFYHGLDSKTGIVVKELAVVWVKSRKRQHWVFLPPYPESCLPEEVRALNAERLVRNKYTWAEGDVPYDRLEGILKQCTEPFTDVFVCGQSRARFIANMINKPVLNFITLYNGVVFAINTGNIYMREHDYASTCLKHDAPKESGACAKARVTYQTNILLRCFVSVRNGSAKVVEVHPDAEIAETVPEAAAIVEPSATNTKQKSSDEKEVVGSEQEKKEERITYLRNDEDEKTYNTAHNYILRSEINKI
jgi:hypothetical protein